MRGSIMVCRRALLVASTLLLASTLHSVRGVNDTTRLAQAFASSDTGASLSFDFRDVVVPLPPSSQLLGNLTLSGNGSVIDASMGFNIVRASRVDIAGLTLANGCISRGLHSTALGLQAWGRQQMTVVSCTVLVRPADLSGELYWAFMQRAQVLSTVRPFLNRTQGTGISHRIVSTSATSVTVTSANTSSVAYVNTTFMSTSDPSNPALGALLNAGLLRPLLWCNGSAYSGVEQDGAEVSLAPQWIVNGTSTSLSAALDAAAKYSMSDTAALPPAVHVAASTTLATTAPVFVFGAPLHIYGPLRDVPGAQAVQPDAVLDLAGKAGVFYAMVDAPVFFINMTLRGLAAQQLVLPGQSLPDTQSALPLWAVSAAFQSSARVYLYNVTLVLPQSDFLAMLQPALRVAAGFQGCQSVTATGSVAVIGKKKADNPVAGLRRPPHMMGVSDFKLFKGGAPPSLVELRLASYAGWGVNGSDLRVLPDMPFPQGYVLPEYNPCDPPVLIRMDERYPATAAATGAALGVGLTVVLILVVVMIYLVRRNDPGRLRAARIARAIKAGTYRAHSTASTSQSQGSRSVSNHVPRSHPPSQCTIGIHSSAPPMSGVDVGVIGALYRPHAHLAIASASTPSTHMHMDSPNTSNVPSTGNHGQARLGGDRPGMEGGNGVGTPGGEAGRASELSPSFLSSNQTGHGSKDTHGTHGTEGVASGGDRKGHGALLKSSNKDILATAKLGPAAVAVAAAYNTDSPKQQGAATTLDPLKALRNAMGALQPDADKLLLSGVIGRGTWGTVYKGVWRSLPVAVKTVLFSESQGGGVPMQRAITEAAVCASVNHRNVVATYHYDFKAVELTNVDSKVKGLKQGTGQPLQVVYDLEQGQGNTEGMQMGGAAAPHMDYRLYLVQELCSTTLAHALKTGVLHLLPGQPDLELVLALLQDVAQGLEHLHAKNIMHGDLKPANVMLKNDLTCRIRVVAKLTDFGLAMAVDPQASSISNYSSGTPFYVAPEVQASHQASRASDLYSFGVMMWELYRGIPPWVVLRDVRAAMGRAFAPNPTFPAFPAGTPVRYAALTAACLSRDPKARPLVGEVLAELSAMIEARDAGHADLRGGTPDAMALATAMYSTTGQSYMPSTLSSMDAPPQNTSMHAPRSSHFTGSVAAAAVGAGGRASPQPQVPVHVPVPPSAGVMHVAPGAAAPGMCIAAAAAPRVSQAQLDDQISMSHAAPEAGWPPRTAPIRPLGAVTHVAALPASSPAEAPGAAGAAGGSAATPAAALGTVTSPDGNGGTGGSGRDAAHTDNGHPVPTPATTPRASDGGQGTQEGAPRVSHGAQGISPTSASMMPSYLRLMQLVSDAGAYLSNHGVQERKQEDGGKEVEGDAAGSVHHSNEASGGGSEEGTRSGQPVDTADPLELMSV